MVPAIEADPKIPIFIRNTFNPSFPGTRIYTSSTTHMERDQCVCGFSTIEGVALINVEGCGMIGVQGVAKRLFATLQSIGVNVILISQASSEHSISFACEERQSKAAKEAIVETFAKELHLKHISAVEITAPCSIIAAVGDGMSSTTGVAGVFFSALGDAHINVLAIAQGCSERNISAVIYTQESTRALRAVHAAFRLSHTTVRVGIIGIDEEIGQSLLKLMETQREKLIQTFDIDFQVCAVLKSSSSTEEQDGDVGGSEKLFVLNTDQSRGRGSITKKLYDSIIQPKEDSASKYYDAVELGTVVENGMSSLLKHLISKDCAHTVVFDCTADQRVANEHPRWLQAGVHVVTANSKGLSGPRELRNAIDRAERCHGKLSATYLREVTAAGALPVISTLRDLLNSGDQIRRIDGILSVSLSYIMHRVAPPPKVVECELHDQLSSGGAFRRSYSQFHAESEDFSRSCSFSQAVREAIMLGLMEKDPLKDLSNEYVARILMVLAKELGIAQSYDLEQIQMASDMLMVSVETLSDEDGRVSLRKKSIDGIEEYEKVSETLDAKIAQRVAEAAKKGCVPRHVASIDVAMGEMTVRIVDVPSNHIFATTPPSCAVVRFFTHRHKRYPLVVQGPAEGADSTASALLAELLHLMRSKIGPKGGALSRSQTSAFLSRSV
jgi:aspartokinase/homoserine dehydrogenase 1